MLRRILKDMKSKESGFTLIELLIVVAIIAILAAIAIPQFSAYRERGIRAAMVSDARNAVSLEELAFSDTQAYAALAATGPGPTTGAVGSGTLRISTGNTVTITVAAGPPATYSISVANANAGTGKSPVTFTSAGACTFADATTC